MSANVLAVVKRRHTTLEFSAKPVPQKKLLKIVEAGRNAPSSHNAQDWKFILIKNKKTIAQLMGICTYGSFYAVPPSIIAIVAEPLYHDKPGLLKGNVAQHAFSHRYLNIGFAAAYLVLAAESINIKTAILTPLVAEANKILHVPKESEAILLIGVGYEKRNAYRKEKERKSLKQVLRFEKYSV